MHPNGKAVVRDGDETLTLECYGAGFAPLRPEIAPSRPATPLSRLQQFARRFAAATRPATRYALTDKGRRDLAMAAVFGASPTVARVYDQFRATYRRSTDPSRDSPPEIAS